MTNFRRLILVAVGGSLGLLLGAFFFQYVIGLAPCKMCIWQRWPHAAAIAIGAAALALGNRALAWLGALAAGTTAAIGVFHTGVERGWWEGPTTCSSASPSGVSSDALFDQIMSAQLIRCDEVAWSFLSLSMASWNAVASLGLALVWIAAARTVRN